MMTMPWQQKISYLIGQPVGISLTNGQGTSGVLCGTSGEKLLVNICIKHNSPNNNTIFI